jgi:ABC-type lipoprotein release transport system permease subunit
MLFTGVPNIWGRILGHLEMFLGIVAGHFPARQASRMEVAEAVRYE